MKESLIDGNPIASPGELINVFLLGKSEEQQASIEWMREHPEVMLDVPTYHRIQIERLLWDNRDKMTGNVLDIGAAWRRDWIPAKAYTTFGPNDKQDRRGALPHSPFDSRVFDVVICTEVLEHVIEPGLAIAEMRRILRFGGWLFASTPMCWPQHGTDDYPDYWRFTSEWWALQLQDWSYHKVMGADWTDEGRELIEMVGQWEGWISEIKTKIFTGLFVEAQK